MNQRLALMRFPRYAIFLIVAAAIPISALSSESSDAIRKIVDDEMPSAIEKVRKLYLSLEIEERTVATGGAPSEGPFKYNGPSPCNKESLQRFYGSEDSQRYRLDRLDPHTKQLLSAQIATPKRLAVFKPWDIPKDKNKPFRLVRLQHLKDPLQMYEPLVKQWGEKKAPLISGAYSYFVEGLLNAPSRLDPSYLQGVYSWVDETQQQVKFFKKYLPNPESPTYQPGPEDGMVWILDRQHLYVPLKIHTIVDGENHVEWLWTYEGEIEGVPLLKRMEYRCDLDPDYPEYLEVSTATLIRKSEAKPEKFSLEEFGYSDFLTGIPPKPRRSYGLLIVSTLFIGLVMGVLYWKSQWAS